MLFSRSEFDAPLYFRINGGSRMFTIYENPFNNQGHSIAMQEKLTSY